MSTCDENLPVDEPSSKKQKLDEDIENENGASVDAEGPEEESSEEAQPLKEKDVGMTVYLGVHEGFTAIIKQRFSDFLVQEVDISGKRVVLTETGEPACDEQSPEGEQTADVDNVFTEEQLEALKKANSTYEGEVLIPAPDDKAIRARIHQTIRKHFGCLESAFHEQDGTKYIKVFPSKNTKEKRQRGWPKGRPEYCKFVLYKENTDTIEAVNILAKYMRINASAFAYAGTKDKRAKTTQNITCFRMPATRLQKLNRVLRNMVLGNFSYCPAPLKLGDLQGNQFNVVLRNVTGSEEQVQAGMQVLQSLGFVNYFGMQRFGTTSVPTFHIGRAILHSKWEEVIDLILQPREGDNAMVARARKTWKETQDAHAALAGFTKPCTERHLLVGLRDCGKNDLTAAINRISKNTRLMYLHSYQAFIWNRMVSERLRMGGTKLLPGDLVIPVADMRSNKRAAPVVVTEDNLYQFTIHDLVLPSPGYDMTYPEGALREKYEALLAEDGLTLDSFRHKNKDYSLSGMYRAVIHKPDDLEYELLRYEDYTKPLVLSDLDKLQGQTLDDEKEDRLLALRLKFTLPPSTYATMAIRELLKCDTSAAFQSTLNVS